MRVPEEAVTAGSEALEEKMGLGRDEALHYAATAIEAAAPHLTPRVAGLDPHARAVLAQFITRLRPQDPDSENIPDTYDYALADEILTEITADPEPVVLPVFTGPVTPRAVVAALKELPSIRAYGVVSAGVWYDEFSGQTTQRVVISTGGFSENEELLAQLRRTLFWLMWWDSTHRGGTFIFQLPLDAWDTPVERLAEQLGTW